LKLIIQGLLRLYNKDLSADLEKTKVLKMAFTGKAAFNIDGTTIHSALNIPINQSLTNLSNLSSDILNRLTNKYEQLQLVVIDEISLVGARMFNVVDQRLRSIKHIQNKYFGNLDLIMTGDFYQAPPVKDGWIFDNIREGFNSLAPSFWHTHVKCYQLKKVMRQSDLKFIETLNRFRTSTQTLADIHFINNECFRQPPKSLTIPYLFYTNKHVAKHNEKVFNDTIGPTFTFQATDIPNSSCPPNFKLPNDPSKTAGLYSMIHLKNDMLVELCAGNYDVSDGLVNGADGIFKGSTTYSNKSIMWILFFNSKVGSLTREKSVHFYTIEIEKTWTPIEPLVKEIRAGKSQTYVVTRIQFPIQLAAARTIHRSQGLSLDELAFDPTNVRKHGLTYTALSRVRTKEKLYLLAPLQNENFHVDERVKLEMLRLTTTSKWHSMVPDFKRIQHSHVIIQALNTNSLRQYFKDISSDHSLQCSNILCLIETRLQASSNEIHKFIDISKYNYLSAYDGHGLLMLYDKNMTLNSYEITTIDGSEYIMATFNSKTRNAIHVISVYKAHNCSITTFLKALQNLIQKSIARCPTIILGDFNIDILDCNDSTQNKTKLVEFMKHFNLQSQFHASTTKGGTQLDHIWANVPGNDCESGVSEAYWPDYHKPIYIAFKLPNILPIFNSQTVSSLFL
jgi:hypothetical protein